MKHLERLAARFLIRRIRPMVVCPDVDKNVGNPNGCMSCRAKIAIEVIEDMLDSE